MAYQTIRPSSAPYNLTGTGLATFSSDWGVVDPIPTTDLGSLADDSDATYATFSSNSDGVSYDATVLAVDFAPVPGYVEDSQFGAFARISRPWTPAGDDSYQNSVIALYDSSWNLLGSPPLDFSDIAGEGSGDLTFVPADPATYTSGIFFSANRGSLAAGFTAVMMVRANVAAPTEVLRIYEFGLSVDIEHRNRPDRRKYPNPSGGGLGPRRHWPRPRRSITGLN